MNKQWDEWQKRVDNRVIQTRSDIISRMEAMQSRFGRLQLEDRADWVQDGDPTAFAGESELEYNERTGRYEESE